MHRFHNPDVAKLVLRIALGIVFIVAGWFKLTNMELVVGMFASMGVPVVITYIVSYGEFIAGIAVLLGVFTSYAALFIAIIMLSASLIAHWPNGFSLANGGYEYTFVLMLVAIALLMLGSGRYALIRNS